MPLLPSQFPSSKSCYMKTPSGINTQCHVIWRCEGCSRLSRVGSLRFFPTHFPSLFLELIALAFWQFGLFSLSISLICVLPRHSLSGLWKYLPNIKKYQSNYYYDFSHGDGLPRPLCPAALIFSGLSPYSGFTLGSVHCLIEFSGFYWKASKNNFIGKGPGEVKTLLV